MFKKLAILVVLAAFISTPAFAGKTPEFDAVGDDSANYFNDFIRIMVSDYNQDYSGVNLNQNSAFYNEYFATSASGPAPSACFPGYSDYKAGPWFMNTFEWNIVLQMAPETDLDLVVRDCVLDVNQRDMFFYAQQTGRWRENSGRLVFQKAMNPRITVVASPGPRQPASAAPFFMDARKMPNLGLTALNSSLYTSKSLWQENIVMKLPVAGTANQEGEPVFVLREGDVINVKVDIPFNNPVDIYYGQDNVVVQYVGMIGMDIIDSEVVAPAIAE